MYELCRYTRRTPLGVTPPIKYGDIVYPNDTRISQETRAKFLASGTLVRLELPPLAALPESWQERTELLATVNIFTIGDLLAANERELGRAISTQPKLIRTWKTEAERWLDNPNRQTSSND